MKFPYRSLPVASGGAGEPEPIVRVVLVGPRGRAITRAVVDSGSVETMLPAEALELAGIAVSSEEVLLSGIGGASVACRVAQARLELAHGRIQYESRVCAFPRGTRQLAVLGRKDLFLRYYVAFAAREGEGAFWINEYRQ
jgi:hypothetical protein